MASCCCAWAAGAGSNRLAGRDRTAAAAAAAAWTSIAVQAPLPDGGCPACAPQVVILEGIYALNARLRPQLDLRVSITGARSRPRGLGSRIPRAGRGTRGGRTAADS